MHEKAALVEEIGLKIINKQTEDGDLDDLTPEELENLLSEYGEVKKDDNEKIIGVIPIGKDYTITLKEIYNGTTESGETQTGVPTWTQVGTTITYSDGNTYEIGDKVLYDCVSEVRNANSSDVATEKTEGKKYYTKVTSLSAQIDDFFYGSQIYTLPTSYENSDITWHILGVEDGKLLLGSSNIESSSTPYKYYSLEGKNGYEKGIEELDKIGALYGQSEFVEKAESMKIEHVNNITGYDPEHTGLNKNTGLGTDQGKYGKDTIEQYNLEVNYSWGGESNLDKPAFSYYLDGASVPTTGNLSQSHGSSLGGYKFWYFKNGSWAESFSYTMVPNTPIVSLVNSYYRYNPLTLVDDSGTGANVGLNPDSKAYNYLFTDWRGTILASRCLGVNINNSGFVAYCYFKIDDYGVNDIRSAMPSVTSNGSEARDEVIGHIRAVVTLKPNIQLTETTDGYALSFIEN